MKRRKFGKVIVAGTASIVSTSLSCSNKSTSSKGTAQNKALMHVGCQRGKVTEKELQFKVRHGVYHIDGGSPRMIPGKGWDVDDAFRQKELCEKYDVHLDAYHLPLTSAGIQRVSMPNIMLGKSPERDREIEMLQQMIQVAAMVGVRTLLYNTTILPVVRTEASQGRGGVTYSTFDLETAMSNSQDLTSAGPVRCGDVP